MVRMATRRQVLQWLAALGIEPPLLKPRVVAYEPRPARWPRELDLTIAVLADIHACKPWMNQNRIGRIVDRTNGLGKERSYHLSPLAGRGRRAQRGG